MININDKNVSINFLNKSNDFFRAFTIFTLSISKNVYKLVVQKNKLVNKARSREVLPQKWLINVYPLHLIIFQAAYLHK